MSDSHIPPKEGRLRKRFGFVRFCKEEDAVNSILLLNGTIIRGNRIKVCMTRYGKGGIGNSASQVS